jgi:hypothetical protein
MKIDPPGRLSPVLFENPGSLRRVSQRLASIKVARTS